MGVSKNGGTKKWMVYNGKPYFLTDDLFFFPTIFGNNKNPSGRNPGGFEVEECHRVSYHWRSEMGLASDTQVPQNLRESPLPWASWMAVIGNKQQNGNEVDWRGKDVFV